MKKKTLRLLIPAIAAGILMLANTIKSYSQCGADGTQPCGQTTKSKTIKSATKNKSTKPIVQKPKAATALPKKELFPTVTVNSDEQMIGTSPKGDKLEVVSFEYDKKLEGSKYQSIIAKFKYGLNSASSCRIFLEAFAKGKEVTVAYGGSNKYSGNGEDSNYVMWDREKAVDEFHLKMVYSDGRKIRALLVLAVKLKRL